MRKITLIVASFLLTLSVANAANEKTAEVTLNRNSFDDPISFIERGIEFFVFPNGDFDFNSRPEDSHGSTYYYKGAGKKGTTVARGSMPVNYGVIIEQDSFGRVRRVGNVFINYDFNDRVNRIGTVYMRYNRFALTQIGGLHIEYNRYGEIVDMYGAVKGRNQGYAYGHQYSNGNHYGNSNSSTYYGNSNNYYYKNEK
jgi:hypothetical protein